METFQEGGDGPDVSVVPNDAAKPASLLPRDSLFPHGGQGMQAVASSYTAIVGGPGGAVRACGGKCVGRVGCVRASVELQIKCSAATPQEHPSSRHGKTLITLGSVAPSGTSQDDSEPHVSRTKQDQRTSSTNALFWTRHPEHDASNPPGRANAPCKEHVSKNFSHVAANPHFGATPLGGRSSHPAGNLTSAVAGAKVPPRPWEPRVLLLALLLAASANGKSSGTHIKLLVLQHLVL